MNNAISWRRFWEDNSTEDVPDFKLDRGISPRDQEIENLSERELIDFIQPGQHETLLDAGCGTGINILRLHARVKNIIGIDFAAGSIERCRRRIHAHQIPNAQVYTGGVTDVPLPDGSVNRILCLSVLQYLDDDEVRKTLREFVRVSLPGGILILHVKNSSSLYWSTLRFGKRLKSLLGQTTGIYNLRSFRWYVNELAALDCRILEYKSFNLLTLDFVPRPLTCFLQRFELRHHNGWLFRIPFVRSRGADLKIKAAVGDRCLGSSETKISAHSPR